MTDHHAPPHMTISSIEARNPGVLIPYMETLKGQLKRGSIQVVSVGALFPYVLYAAPVLNDYLNELSKTVFDSFAGIPETSISRFYRPGCWLPHITLGKTLDQDQMQIAFRMMQEEFVPMEGHVMGIGLAKTNPHEDLMYFEL